MTGSIPTGASMRPYKLVSFNCYSAELRTEHFNKLADLAYVAHRASWYLQDNARKWFVSETYAVAQRAFTPSGKPIAMEDLLPWGARLSWQRHVLDKLSSYIWRDGPMHGIRKGRGGSSSRPVRVQNERRVNALVLTEEGEVSARVPRCGLNLPDCWDGRNRTVQRCWKSQHKGRKSWDRPAPHGKQ